MASAPTAPAWRVCQMFSLEPMEIPRCRIFPLRTSFCSVSQSASVWKGWLQQHLYDGDAASNTLSWRWVAGVHTRGKCYLARPDNIAKYTDGRFPPEKTLAGEPLELSGHYPEPEKVPLTELSEPPTDGRLGLLVHDDDLSAPEWVGEPIEPATTCAFFSEATHKAYGSRPNFKLGRSFRIALSSVVN